MQISATLLIGVITGLHCIYIVYTSGKLIKLHIFSSLELPGTTSSEFATTYSCLAYFQSLSFFIPFVISLFGATYLALFNFTYFYCLNLLEDPKLLKLCFWAFWPKTHHKPSKDVLINLWCSIQSQSLTSHLHDFPDVLFCIVLRILCRSVPISTWHSRHHSIDHPI